MQVNIGLKTPGFSAFALAGLGIGAVMNKDFGNAAIAFLVIALDVVRIERATDAVQ
jgi:hypothetical protein